MSEIEHTRTSGYTNSIVHNQWTANDTYHNVCQYILCNKPTEITGQDIIAGLTGKKMSVTSIH